MWYIHTIKYYIIVITSYSYLQPNESTLVK